MGAGAPLPEGADEHGVVAQRRIAGSEADSRTMIRFAAAPGARDADIWIAIDASASLNRWVVVLRLIERHEFELDPWRMTPLRLEALIELGWHRRALNQLAKDYGHGYVRGHEAVELLVKKRALALAARFIDGPMSGDLWRAEARATLLAIATRTCAATSIHEAPLPYADAIQARDILLPGREPIESAVADALRVLTASAGKLLASDDPAGAASLLIAAARLAPTDRKLLESLADAAHCAGLTERYLDTQLRIWTTHRDVSALVTTVRGVLETSFWPMISEVMRIAMVEAASLGPEAGAIARRYRELASDKVGEYISIGDVASGLELVATVSHQFSSVEWPDALISRLLRLTKRVLRNAQAGGGALAASLGPLYLELAPLDVDVCRMLALVRLRQRRLSEARELLDRVVAINPHVAGDWLALAMVQDELEDFNARDFSVVRSILIAPDDSLPPTLAMVRERMGLV
jgi:hypothetical protein